MGGVIGVPTWMARAGMTTARLTKNSGMSRMSPYGFSCWKKALFTDSGGRSWHCARRISVRMKVGTAIAPRMMRVTCCALRTLAVVDR